MSKWNPRGVIEQVYQRRLINLSKRIADFYEQAQNVSDIQEISRRIFMSKDFKDATLLIAKKMVSGASSDNAKSWRDASRKSTKSRLIHKALLNESRGQYGSFLAQRISENAALIQTIPQSIANEMTNYALTETEKGIRSSDIAKSFLERIPGLSENRANLIARTEVSKVHTDIIETRSLYLEIPCYIWRATKGGRTRPSHRNMDGVIIFWSDPPSPEALLNEKDYGKYHAGKIFNCRCYPAPLVSVDDVPWPHKVFKGGQIITMTRSQFLKIVG